MLNFIFLMHTVVAVVVAFLLTFFTEWFTLEIVDSLTQPQWPGGTIEAIIVAYARLTAVGLIMIGTSTLIARISGHSAVRWAALIAMVVIGVAFMLISLFLNLSPLSMWVFLINLVFVALYLWIAFFHRKTV
jgi:hypothetical protein